MATTNLGTGMVEVPTHIGPAREDVFLPAAIPAPAFEKSEAKSVRGQKQGNARASNPFWSTSTLSLHRGTNASSSTIDLHIRRADRPTSPLGSISSFGGASSRPSTPTLTNSPSSYSSLTPDQSPLLSRTQIKRPSSPLAGKRSALFPSTVSLNTYHHPYVPETFDMANHQHLVRDTEPEDEENCPVCLESLAMRLAGEKPHIVPICGHKLHEACFEAVYGSVSRARSRPMGSLGLCGVCRRDMKLGDPGDHGKNKFAALTGLPGARNSPPLDSHKVRSISKKTIPSDSTGGRATHDPNDDDDLMFRFGHANGHAHHDSADTAMAPYSSSSHLLSYPASLVAGSSASVHSPPSEIYPPSSPKMLCQPKISVRAEHPAIIQSGERDKKSHITCLVTIEIPAKIPALRVPEAKRPRGMSSSTTPTQHRRETTHASADSTADDTMGYSYSTISSSNDPLSPTHYHGEPGMHEAFQGIVRDLQSRMSDWKGHSPDDFGKLHMYDMLSVRKEQKVREFYIYLFSEALLCVAEDSKSSSETGAGKLRLKGRVYVRHIATVIDSSDPHDESGEYSLTITMDDDALDVFVIIFKSAGQLQAWKARVEALVEAHKKALCQKKSLSSVRDSAYSGETSQSAYSHGSSLLSKGSRSTATSAPSHAAKEMSTLPEETAAMLENANAEAYHDPARDTFHSSDTMSILRSQMNTPIANLPQAFPPVDLMLIFSVPSPTNAPSSYYLKIKLIKSTLEFLVNNIGTRARLSIVTYNNSEGSRGYLRKTPLLAVGKEQGRQRLLQYINDIGSETPSEYDANVDQRDEQINVVTAVNLALDVILQRKAKSALTGIVLMNDGRDGAHRQQMDLVMARAEAAAVPIHTFGWGRAHEAQSLWLLSSHTSGTYTFVKELYGLRESIAGCVGGIMSIAATSMKLFISVPEKKWFRIRKVSGINGALISADGHEVDVNLGEVRAGEKREMLIEVEMNSLGSSTRKRQSMQPFQNQSNGSQFGTATDDFLRKNGLNPLSLEDYGHEYENDVFAPIDEVPLFEVNASYKDPLAGKYISRLPYPVLLLTTIAPPPSDGIGSPSQPSDHSVVRRRVELLCADMETRCILLMSRRNPQQAHRLLVETHRIIGTIASGLPGCDSKDPARVADHALAVETLAACLEDIAYLREGVEQKDQFDTNHRNYAAQSAVMLRDQKSWVGRTSTERLFWRSDYSLWLANRSVEMS